MKIDAINLILFSKKSRIVGVMYPCPCYHQSIRDEENLQVGRNLKNTHSFCFRKMEVTSGLQEVTGGR
jgi:hypothetical protein